MLSGVADTEVEPSVIIYYRIPFGNVDDDAILAIDILGTGLGDEMEFVADGIRYGLGGPLDILDTDIFAVVLATDDHAAALGVVEGGDVLRYLSAQDSFHSISRFSMSISFRWDDVL